MSLADFIGYLEKIIFVNLIRKIDLLTNSIHILIIARLISLNAKDTPNRSAFHKYKYIIRSFVNVGADVELARSRPANGAFAPSDFLWRSANVCLPYWLL